MREKEESFHWLLELMSLFLATNLLPLLRDSPSKVIEKFLSPKEDGFHLIVFQYILHLFEWR